ncbi:MAG: TRAP transporter TatT component family protein [Vicinamibacterales bacterium]
MRSCIALFYLLVSVSLVSAAADSHTEGRRDSLGLLHTKAEASAPGATRQAADPDALYADRENASSARRAADTWAARLLDHPGDFESAWKLARARYWLGTQGPEPERKRALDAGIAAGHTAVHLAPNRPEGHFWLAANMGALAEAFGLRRGIKYRGDIRQALERSLALDPGFLQGSADRALGRWYFKVPGMFGGSKKRSEAHLRKALTYNPQSIITRLFLAETLIDLDRKAEARNELEAALAAPIDPDWAPEDRRFKDQAKKLLSKVSR